MKNQRLNRRLLLISNSFCHGQGYLEHSAVAISTLLKGIDEVLFIPYALKNWDEYTEKPRDFFSTLNISVRGIHEFRSPRRAVENAQSVFVGGGNTWRLLKTLYDRGPLPAIRRRVNQGMPYLGASAGANLACPTIQTTNDMMIVVPPSVKALNLVPFQINPHYLDPDPNSRHMGETRQKRIEEFLEENKQMVIGIREGSWIRVEKGTAYIEGETGAVIFLNSGSPSEWSSPLGLW